jgi:hypothetical protein
MQKLKLTNLVNIVFQCVHRKPNILQCVGPNCKFSFFNRLLQFCLQTFYNDTFWWGLWAATTTTSSGVATTSNANRQGRCGHKFSHRGQWHLSCEVQYLIIILKMLKGILEFYIFVGKSYSVVMLEVEYCWAYYDFQWIEILTLILTA